MIKSFRSKALQAFFERGDGRKLSVQNPARIARMLRALEVATRPEDMSLPGYRFHGLSGNSQGRFAIWVSGNWRITFAWDQGGAADVDLEDYH